MTDASKFLIVLLIFSVQKMCWCKDLHDKPNRGPRIIENLPDQVDFSNDTGTVIECRTEGKPSPAVKWVRADGSPVNNVPGLREILINGSLYFTPFSAKDYRQDIHASVYRCMATNSLGTVISNDVRIRAAVKQFYEIQVYDQYVIQGNTAVLTCAVPPFIQEFIIFTSWEKSGRNVQETVVENGRYSIHPDGVLHIRDVRQDGTSFRYSCTTRHRLTSEVKRSASYGKVVVTEPSGSVSPQIAHSRSVVEAWQGEKVRLPCVAQGLPIPQYRWERHRDSHVTAVKLGDKVHLLDDTLVIRNAQIEDSGTYVCVANNSVGIERAETLLTVIAPLSAFIHPTTQNVDEGDSATLACTTSGYPVTFVSWIKDGRFLAMDDRVKLLSREILRIDSVRREDRGVYQCIARNDRFSVQASAELKLGNATSMFLHKFREQTIHAGNPLSLKCAASGSQPLEAKWTLDDESIASVNVVSERDDIISYVNISKAMTEDGGLYQCIVSNRLATIKHSARVNVYGPPVVRVMPNVSAVAGRDAVLRCRTSGYPVDSIHWEKDGQTLPTNHRQKVFSNGTLIIQQVNRITDAGYYSCLAIGRQAQSAQRPVHLSVLNAPVINPFSFPTNLRVGVRAGIQCLIIEGDQPVSITWLKDDRPIPLDAGISTTTLDEMTRSLIIGSIGPWHNGNYTCVAANAADSVRHTAQLFVNVPPRWLVEPSNSSVILHRAHHLDCQAEGSPTPAVTWKKAIGRIPRDYKLVSLVSISVQEANNGSLLIRSAQEHHEGYYLCQVSNGVGSELSKVIYLDVQVPAYFEDKLRNQSIVKGKDSALTCTAKGDEPISIQWKTTEKTISSNLPRFLIKERPNLHGVMSELIITRAERGDTNVYQCEATNPFGQDSSKVYLLVKETPEAPKSPTIISKNSRTVHISWKPPFDGNSPIQQYVIQYRTDAETWDKDRNITVPGAETATTLKGLRPATRYPLRILAENDIGVGAASDTITITTNEEAPEGPPLDVNVAATDSRSLRVTWKPPSKLLRNGEIQGYHIGYRELDSDGQFVFKTHGLAAPAKHVLEYLMTDLKKFCKYVVVVEAFNALGVGPRSAEFIASTLEDVPSKPPYAVKCATLSSHSITLEWEPPPPTSQHGILLGYKILYKSLEKVKDDQPHTVSTATSIAPNVVLENMTKFTNYSMRILAFNTAGEGRLSEATHCRTDEDVPGAPAEIKALVMSSDAVLLSWRPPSAPNGIITKYTVYTRNNGQGNLKPMSHTVPPTQLYYEARGLEEEFHYEFWTTASTTIGEGEATEIVSQSPTSIVPARIASFPERIAINRKEDIRLECRAVGIPTPDREWKIRGEKVQEKSRLRVMSDGSLLITNGRIQDSGNYSCRVINIYAHDEIFYELVIKGPQGKDTPPATPSMEVKYRTKTSLTLAWSINDEEQNPIHGYTLSYKESNAGDWKEFQVDADNESYTLENLKCGTRYQFYIIASNRIGKSEPSDMLDASTHGYPPESPNREAFVRINVTSVSLQLNAWSDGGCPITDFLIEYRAKDATEWQKMVHDAAAAQRQVLIAGLRSDTLYTVRVVAHNEADSTTVEYDLTTLMDGAGRGLSDYAVDKSAPDLLNYLDLNIIIPVATIAGILIMGVTILCAAYQCRRYVHNKSGGGHARKVMRALTSRHSSRRAETDMASPKADTDKAAMNKPSCYRDSATHDDICPYATYELPACNANDPASMQLKTFSHVKASQDNWPQPKIIQTTKLTLSKREPNVTGTDGGSSGHYRDLANVGERVSPTNRLPPFDGENGSGGGGGDRQLSWFPDTVLGGELNDLIQIHPPFGQTTLVPSAPPAEGDRSTDSERADGDDEGTLRTPPKHGDRYSSHIGKSKPLHRVPDLLYHRQESNTSNEDSTPERDKISTMEDHPKERDRGHRRHSRSSVARQRSADLTPDEVPFNIPEPLHAPPGFADKHLVTSTVRGDSSKAESEKTNQNSRNLAAEEEELIALLKRGHGVVGDHQIIQRDERGVRYSSNKK